MKKKLSLKLFETIVIVILFISAYSCSDDNTTPVNPYGPEANSISGTITFADTNFITSGGYYDLSGFNAWFPTGSPTRSDSLIITKVGTVYKANYKLQNLPNGTYYLTSAWIKIPYGTDAVFGLGLYGCDTAGGCTPAGVTIVNNVGRENINFISWADTTNKIYHF